MNWFEYIFYELSPVFFFINTLIFLIKDANLEEKLGIIWNDILDNSINNIHGIRVHLAQRSLSDGIDEFGIEVHHLKQDKLLVLGKVGFAKLQWLPIMTDEINSKRVLFRNYIVHFQRNIEVYVKLIFWNNAVNGDNFLGYQGKLTIDETFLDNFDLKGDELRIFIQFIQCEVLKIVSINLAKNLVQRNNFLVHILFHEQ